MSSQFPLLTFSAKTDFSHDYEGVKFEIDIGRNAEERLIINFNGFLDIQQDGHQLGGGFKLKAPYKVLLNMLRTFVLCMKALYENTIN